MVKRAARLIGIALAVEVLAIAMLVALVAILGPSEPDAAHAYAERLGLWVGPIAGFMLCIAGGWLAARNETANRVAVGLALGALVAVIDVGLLIAGGAAFHIVFVISNVGRLVAGALGGRLARGSAEGPTEGSIPR